MIKNANQLPKRYYGMHMVPGLAEYKDKPEDKPYRIYLNDVTTKQMDPTFEGKPVYVQHVNEVDLKNLQSEADGYVVRSFYNKLDGQHWVEFLAVSDRAHEAVQKGWRLSNAYVPKMYAGGGRLHNVQFDKEVKSAEYEHLAIVPNPRYEESIILTPDQFAAYNAKKELELAKTVTNSKETVSMLNFFKKSKVENSDEIANSSVTLDDGREVTVAELIAAANKKPEPTEPAVTITKNAGEAKDEKKENDEDAKKKAAEEEEEAKKNAHVKNRVKVGNVDMSVGELCEKYQALLAPPKEDEDKKENSGDKADPKPADESKKKEGDEAFQRLLNAHLAKEDSGTVETSDDQVARGKNLYGSAK